MLSKLRLCGQYIIRRTMTDQSAKYQRHPPHLKGKAIGLWYAKQSRERKEKQSQDCEGSSSNTSDHLNYPFIALGPSESKAIDSLSDPNCTCNNILNGEGGSRFMNEFYKYTREVEVLERRTFDPQHVDKSENHNPASSFQLDDKFMKELSSRSATTKYQTLQNFRKSLPSYSMKEKILNLIYDNQVVVVTGETGCGKTTQVPQFILDSYIASGRGSTCKIICTQPRRISAISVAERVAEERCSSCGGASEVGYQIRLENRQPRDRGSILYCTTGIMTQQLQYNPFLEGISHVVIDEVHERDILADFLMMMMRDLLTCRRDLKLILMSATVNAKEFSQYFGDCPMIEIPGFTYPVESFMLEDIIEMTRYEPDSSHQRGGFQRFKKKKDDEEAENKLEYLKSLRSKYSPQTIETLSIWDDNKIDLNLIIQLLKQIDCTNKEGAVLIFLPGWSEISSLNKLINEDYYFNCARYLIIPLHSLMPTIMQRQVFDKPPTGVRKIILATNIAETSITINDVVFVIDSGKIKMKTFDPVNNIQMLQPEWVAVANIRQRQGRAGRTQPGICYHMYTRFKEAQLDDYQLPEMLRTSLEELILQIKLLKLGKIESFLSKAINPPDPRAVQTSINTLIRLGAICKDEILTPLGYHLACLPVPPHIGKMMIYGAMFSCLNPILSVAAVLSFKDPFIIPLGHEREVDEQKKKLADGTLSDHMSFANVITGWENAERRGGGAYFCSKNFLSYSTIKMLLGLKKQYAGYLKKINFIEFDDAKHRDYNQNSNNIELFKAILCAGLYPNIAKVKSTSKFQRARGPLKGCTEDGAKVTLHPKSVNSDEPCISTGYLMYYVKIKSCNVFLHDTTAISQFGLLLFGGYLNVLHLRDCSIISMDKWIKFRCSQKDSLSIMKLKTALGNFLKYRIQDPGVTKWSLNSNEGHMMKCICNVIETGFAGSMPKHM